MKCLKHPKYKAVQAPRIDCTKCWDLYESKHGKTVAVQKYLRFHRGKAAKSTVS